MGLLAAILLAASLAAATPASAQVPAGADWREVYIRSADGTRVHLDVLTPEGLAAGARTPVVLHATPYGAHSGMATLEPDLLRRGPHPRAEFLDDRFDLFARGYSLVIADLRGFGGSEGCWDFGGPGEQADVFAAVEWAAAQPWSNGRVGMYGLSYDGFTGVMGLATAPRGLAAVALAAPVVSTYRTQYRNGVHYVYDYVAPPLYALFNMYPGSLQDSPEYHGAWLSGVRSECLTATQTEVLDPDPAAAWWRARDLAARAARSRVPTLLAQGFPDPAVKPDQLFSLLELTRRRPQSLWLGQWLHESPGDPAVIGRAGWVSLVKRFFEETLRGQTAPEPEPPVVVQEAPSGRWRAERVWPPLDAQHFAFALQPGGYRDMPGNSGEQAPLHSVGEPGPPALLTGRGTWTFTAPLAQEAHLAGEPSVTLRAAGPDGATAIALLYDVAPDGGALLVSRGASLLSGGRAAFELAHQDWRFAPGHRIGVLITGAADEWWQPLQRTGAQVDVTSGTLSLPLLSHSRTSFLDGERGARLGEKKPIQIAPETIADATVPLMWATKQRKLQ